MAVHSTGVEQGVKKKNFFKIKKQAKGIHTRCPVQATLSRNGPSPTSGQRHIDPRKKGRQFVQDGTRP